MTYLKYLISICDDEKAQSENLRKIASRWAVSRGDSADISLYGSAESFLFENGERPVCDILLLDVQMGGMSGLELAKNLRGADRHTQIIFVTAFSDFMAEGYDVDAVHYLIKPVNEAKLGEAMDKAAARLSKVEPSLLLPADGETVRISMGDILCIESAAHYQEITAKNGLYRVKTPIYALEKQLDDSFIRCHRSYIVGLRHVQKISKTDVILDNGKAVPLSRRLYDDVNKAFIRHFKGAEE